MAFLLFSLFLFTCTPPQFTQENIMKIKVGMSDKEVINLFGYPKKTEASTCGQLLKKPWTCIKWYYGDWKPRFTFQQGDDGNLYLNSWEID